MPGEESPHPIRKMSSNSDHGDLGEDMNKGELVLINNRKSTDILEEPEKPYEKVCEKCGHVLR